MGAEFLEGGYRIKIEDHTPEYRDIYVARVSWMSGDADVYTYSSFPIEPKNLVRSVKALSEANGLRVGGWREEAEITPDIAWFFGGALSEEEYNTLKQRDPDDYEIRGTENYATYLDEVELGDWERDRSCDDCGSARLDGWKLIYYDNAGLPHNVEVWENDQKLTSSYWRE